MPKLTREEYTAMINRSIVMSYDDIAVELDLTKSQVKTIVNRAMQKIRLKAMANGLKHGDCFE